MSGALLLNGNAESEEALVRAAAPFLRDDRPVLLCTAGWAENEHDEAHVKRALNDVGIVSRIEGGFDRSIQNLSLHHELCAVFSAAPELEGAFAELRSVVDASRSFYLAHNAHLVALLRKALSDAKRIEPGIGLAALVGASRAAGADERRSLLRRMLSRELGHALATLEENDRRMVDLLQDLEDRAEDGAGKAYHPVWRAARARLEERIVGAGNVFLFGGRLDLLLGALRFFRLREPLAEALRRGALVVAMSAGAMSLAERVIVYDDFAETRRDFQLFHRGLGLVRDVQLFPHCMDRIQTDDPDNLAYLARRFQHQACVGLNQRSYLLLETSPPRAVSVGTEDKVWVFGEGGTKKGYGAGEEIPL